MKRMQLKIAILASVFSTVASSFGDVELVSTGRNLAESNCTWCHGSLGQGFSTAPQLAAQNRSYIESQLLSFQAHLQDSPSSRQYMWGATATLNSQTARALAVYFSALNAGPTNDGDKALTAEGQRIYQEGILSSNIPSCVPCHGLDAEGVNAIPRLGGQSYHYLKRKLPRWRDGYDAATEPPMPEIARKLSTHEIEALASYLSFVK